MLRIFYLNQGLATFSHRPRNPKDGDNYCGADETEETIGMDIEDFLRDDVAIEEHTSESNPVNDFRWFIGTDSESPECEEDNNRIDNQCEVGEGDTGYHRIWMDDNARTRNGSIDITTT
jgi:hypothetical protein